MDLMKGTVEKMTEEEITEDSTDPVYFLIELNDSDISLALGAISFSHGFLGGTSPDTQDALVELYNTILQQVKDAVEAKNE